MRSRLIVQNGWDRTGPATVADLEIVGPVAFVTERADNPGLSITNNAEAIVALLVARYGPGVRIVEHYDSASYAAGAHPETYDLVTIDDEGHVRWTRVMVRDGDQIYIAGYDPDDDE